MVSLLIAIIYLAFISLGLPDSLLGAAWPTMYGSFGVPLSFAGIVSMIIAAGTITSSLMSDRLTKKVGPGKVTAISVAMTAAALLGFSVSDSFIALCLWSIPYGLGAGAIDAALNNYVALHYSARHMSWLHCFWGVGASVSPYIMSWFLVNRASWQGGYRCVGIIQIVLAAILFLSLPLWKKGADGDGTVITEPKPLGEVLGIDGVKYILLAFFGYCALESTCGLWASSYLVNFRGVDAETAARFASLFYIGITGGRFLCGFIADRLGDRALIRIGVLTAICGILLVMLPIEWNGLSLIGLVIIGLGCAPVYPSVIHATPDNFGKENSQAVVGVQMASAYCGTTFMPPFFGWLADRLGMGLYPFYLLIFAFLIFLMTELLNRRKRRMI